MCDRKEGRGTCGSVPCDEGSAHRMQYCSARQRYCLVMVVRFYERQGRLTCGKVLVCHVPVSRDVQARSLAATSGGRLAESSWHSCRPSQPSFLFEELQHPDRAMSGTSAAHLIQVLQPSPARGSASTLDKHGIAQVTSDLH